MMSRRRWSLKYRVVEGERVTSGTQQVRKTDFNEIRALARRQPTMAQSTLLLTN
jgi:hypothetical protein